MMKKWIYVCVGLIFIAIVITYFREHSKSEENRMKTQVMTPTITCRYYDEKSFMASIKKAELSEPGHLNILGGITPHHLLADQMIAQFFREIATDAPKVIVLMGPNHRRIGNRKIHTGRWSWNTPFGVMEAEKKIIEQIVGKTGADENMKLLENEHSIGALMPYVKYYLPEAKVVPLVLHGNLGLKSSKELANTILECIGDNDYLVVGSVDFSHYLTPDAAEKKDKISIKAIMERDFLEISRMDDDYLDSPPTVITLLEIMNKEDALGLEVLDHSNSSVIAGEYAESNTSYYTLLFFKQAMQ